MNLWLFGNTNKKNGFTFTKKRARELEKIRDFLLDEYESIDSTKHTSKRVIKLTDNFSDSRELIAFYDLKPEECVVYLLDSGKHLHSLNVIPLLHKDIAGVFSTYEKRKKIYFPDGIGDKIVLYNVLLVDKKNNKVHVDKKYFELFDIPSKTRLIKAIFGKFQRSENKDIENILLSMKVISESDSIYFYLATKASKEVRERILNFKDKFFEIKSKSIFTDKVYPIVPDMVSGASFDFEKARKNAKDGVDIEKFYGHIFYEILSNEIPELESILNKEKERSRFIESFPTLEKKLSGQNEYSYVSIDRARYDYTDSISLRGDVDREHCFWDSFLRDLEKLYSDYFSNKNNQVEEDNKKIDSFYRMCELMISGEVSNDDDIISYINMNSSKKLSDQFIKNTTFSFVKMPVIDSQNGQIVHFMYDAAIQYFINTIDSEVDNKFILTNNYKFI